MPPFTVHASAVAAFHDTEEEDKDTTAAPIWHMDRAACAGGPPFVAEPLTEINKDANDTTPFFARMKVR